MIGLSHIAKAEEFQSYQVSLFYDANTQELRLDKFVENPVQAVEQSDQLTYDQRVNFQGSNTFQVQLVTPQYMFPETLNYEIQDGAFQILVPYYPHVNSLKIMNPETNTDFTVSTDEFTQCNQNAICEFEQKENEITCVSDCTRDNTQYSAETKSLLASQNGVIRDQAGTVLLGVEDESPSTDDSSEERTEPSTFITLLPLLAGLTLIAGAGGYWVYRKTQR